jgi:hypothetical protein
VVSDVEARKAWAARFIAAAPADVVYGSEAWLALPEGPAKWGVAVRAAECWQTDLEATLERLRADHRGAVIAAKLAEDLEWSERADAHRREWTGRGFRRSPAIAADVELEWRDWASA